MNESMFSEDMTLEDAIHWGKHFQEQHDLYRQKEHIAYQENRKLQQSIESLRAELDKVKEQAEFTSCQAGDYVRRCMMSYARHLGYHGYPIEELSWKEGLDSLLKHAVRMKEELDKAKADLAKTLAGEWVEMYLRLVPSTVTLITDGKGTIYGRTLRGEFLDSSGNELESKHPEQKVYAMVAPDPRVPELQRENNDLDSKLQEAQERNSALHAEIADLKADAERWRAHSQSLTKANPGECFHVSDHNRVLYPMGVEGYSLTPEAAIQPVVEEWQKAQAAEALTDLVNQMHSEGKLGEAVNFSDLLDDVQPVTVPKKVLDSMPVDVKAGKFVRAKKRKDIAPGKVFRVDGRNDCYIRGAHSQDWNLTQGTSALIQECTRVIEIEEESE